MSLCGGRAMPAGERERRASERTLRSSQNRPIAVSAGDRGGQTVRSKIMFEFGSSLREARIRRGIELAQLAAETRIRTRYLQALEDERFELLPGSVYAKGFHSRLRRLPRPGQPALRGRVQRSFRADEAPPAVGAGDSNRRRWRADLPTCATVTPAA